MRTTFKLEDDVAAEVERLRRDQGLGLSEAVNLLIRRGMLDRAPDYTYEHRTASVGLTVDVTNIGDVLDVLDEN